MNLLKMDAAVAELRVLAVGAQLLLIDDADTSATVREALRRHAAYLTAKADHAEANSVAAPSRLVQEKIAEWRMEAVRCHLVIKRIEKGSTLNSGKETAMRSRDASLRE